MAALPDTKVTEFRSIAVGRAEQRDLIAGVKQEQMDKMTGFASVTTPLVVLACAVWVGLLAWTNVRERRTEIGLWRALGLGAVKIASLFLGKAVLLGLVGGTVGFFLGTWLAQLLGVYALQVGSDYFTPAYGVLVWTIVGAPVVCAMASYLPTLTAVLQDPAVVLSDA
jgi:putative ABC transport system permease protein